MTNMATVSPHTRTRETSTACYRNRISTKVAMRRTAPRRARRHEVPSRLSRSQLSRKLPKTTRFGILALDFSRSFFFFPEQSLTAFLFPLQPYRPCSWAPAATLTPCCPASRARGARTATRRPRLCGATARGAPRRCATRAACAITAGTPRRGARRAARGRAKRNRASPPPQRGRRNGRR